MPVALDYTTFPSGPYCPRCHKSRPAAMMVNAITRCLICWAAEVARSVRAADAAAALIGTHREFNGYACLFHVGFLSLEETPEMLRRLAYGHLPEKSPGPSHSKIGASLLATITPIDRVAARV